MKICDDFEIINVAGEYMAVPIGEKAESIKGLVVLNEATAFLLENMKNSISIDELVSLLTERYDVSRERAQQDITDILTTLLEIGLVAE